MVSAETKGKPMRVKQGWPIRAITIATVVGLGLAGVAAVPATAGEAHPGKSSSEPPQRSKPPHRTEARSGETHQTITLVTGDRVELTAHADGTDVRAVNGPDRAGISFLRAESADGDLRVTPGDALPFLGAGVLDHRLFDVTVLAERGDRSVLPLRIDYASGPALREQLASVDARIVADDPGSLVARLPIVEAGEFWAELAGDSGESGRFAAGVERIRLASPAPPKSPQSPDELGEQAATSHDLTIRAIDNDGRRYKTSVILVDPDTSDYRLIDVDGVTTVRARAGRYHATTGIFDDDRVTLIDIPDVVMDRDRTLVFDARKGKRVRVQTDRRLRQPSYDWFVALSLRTFSHGVNSRNARGWKPVYVVPWPRRSTYHSTFGLAGSLYEPPARSGQRVYHLFLNRSRRVPDPPVFRVHNPDLARVDTRIHGQEVVSDEPNSGSTAGPPWGSGRSAYRARWTHLTPSRSLHLYSPGTGKRWRSAISLRTGHERDDVDRRGRIFRGPGEHVQHWNLAAFGPDSRPHYYELGLYADLASHSVGTPHHRQIGGGRTTGVLRVNGEVVENSTSPFYVDPGPARYEFESVSRRPASGRSRLATRVEQRWRYDGELRDGEVLPIPILQLTGRFDMRNRARADREHPLDVRVTKADGSPAEVERMRFRVSFDQGESWRPMRFVERDSGGWRAYVPRSETGAYVSIYGFVKTTDGNEVEQKVIRAYRITRGS